MRNEGRYTLAPRRRSTFHCLAVFVICVIFVVMAIKTIHFLRLFAFSATPPSNLPAEMDFQAGPSAEIDPAEALLADCYPSKQSALRALALRLPDAIDSLTSKANYFRVTFEDRAPGGAAFYDALRKHFPTATIIGSADTTAKVTGEVTIALRIDDDLPKPPRRTAKGNVQVSVAVSDRAASISTKYVQCDWADDLGDFINEHPGRTWIVARSQKPCLSPSEARRSAEDAATNALWQWIEQRNRTATPLALRLHSPAELRNNIRSPLPVSDRYVQQFHRPYGNVWTEAVLLDVTPQWIESLNHRQAMVVGARENRILTTAASMAIVLVTILLAYLFANGVTKRYFTGRLRAAAIVCALIALAVTLFCMTEFTA